MNEEVLYLYVPGQPNITIEIIRDNDKNRYEAFHYFGCSVVTAKHSDPMIAALLAYKKQLSMSS
ncbi:hypothetical protein WAK64_00915 [Bacillus spongiae]|uniref:Uncharacterized protein n=1 Tax=Bacillus spongiae TaxID=2683610 RepID=A0ABU8H8M9_9BACI